MKLMIGVMLVSLVAMAMDGAKAPEPACHIQYSQGSKTVCIDKALRAGGIDPAELAQERCFRSSTGDK